MKNLTGRRYGSLTVTEFSHVDNRRHAIWKCACDCGKSTLASSSKLEEGKKISCGHLRSQQLKKMRKRSGPKRREDSGLTLDDALTELGAWR